MRLRPGRPRGPVPGETGRLGEKLGRPGLRLRFEALPRPARMRLEDQDAEARGGPLRRVVGQEQQRPRVLGIADIPRRPGPFQRVARENRETGNARRPSPAGAAPRARRREAGREACRAARPPAPPAAPARPSPRAIPRPGQSAGTPPPSSARRSTCAPSVTSRPRASSFGNRLTPSANARRVSVLSKAAGWQGAPVPCTRSGHTLEPRRALHGPDRVEEGGVGAVKKGDAVVHGLSLDAPRGAPAAHPAALVEHGHLRARAAELPRAGQSGHARADDEDLFHGGFPGPMIAHPAAGAGRRGGLTGTARGRRRTGSRL